MAGIAGSVTVIGQVATTGLSLAKHIYEVATFDGDPDKRLIQLAREVRATSKILEDLCNIFEQDLKKQIEHNLSHQNARKATDMCADAFEDVRKLIVGPQKKAWAKWPPQLKDAKLELLRTNIDRVKSSLQLLLVTLTYQLAQENNDHMTEQSLRQQIDKLYASQEEAYERHEKAINDFRHAEEIFVVPKVRQQSVPESDLEAPKPKRKVKKSAKPAVVTAPDPPVDDETASLSTVEEAPTNALRLTIHSGRPPLSADDLAQAVSHVHKLLFCIDGIQQDLRAEKSTTLSYSMNNEVLAGYKQLRYTLDEMILNLHEPPKRANERGRHYQYEEDHEITPRPRDQSPQEYIPIPPTAPKRRSASGNREASPPHRSRISADKTPHQFRRANSHNNVPTSKSYVFDEENRDYPDGPPYRTDRSYTGGAYRDGFENGPLMPGNPWLRHDSPLEVFPYRPHVDRDSEFQEEVERAAQRKRAKAEGVRSKPESRPQSYVSSAKISSVERRKNSLYASESSISSEEYGKPFEDYEKQRDTRYLDEATDDDTHPRNWKPTGKLSRASSRHGEANQPQAIRVYNDPRDGEVPRPPFAPLAPPRSSKGNVGGPYEPEYADSLFEIPRERRTKPNKGAGRKTKGKARDPDHLSWSDLGE